MLFCTDTVAGLARISPRYPQISVIQENAQDLQWADDITFGVLNLYSVTPKGPSVIHRILWYVSGCVAALLLCPTSSKAQSPATTFDELKLALQAGNEVVVTDSNGRRTRGKLVSVTTSSLDLMTKRPRFLIFQERSHQSFADTVVTRVTRIDSRREGALIGLAAGVVPVLLVPCGADYGGGCSLAKVLYGPGFGLAGFALGMVIDGSMNKIVYQAGTASVGRPTISLSPLIGGKIKGASLNLGF